MKQGMGLFLFQALFSIFAWGIVSLLTVLLWVPVALAYLLHRWIDPDLHIAHAIAGLWAWGLVSSAPGCRVKIYGRQNLPLSRPVILMANHQSYSDVPILYFLGHEFKWVADEPLFRIPFFGWSMRMAGYIPVKRGDRRGSLQALERTRSWLRRGVSIFLFPEGTRSHTGQFGRFQTGGFRLAATTQTPIVPVVLIGSRQLLPRGSWVFRMGVKPQIHILPAVSPPSDLRRVHELARRVRAQMLRVFRQHCGGIRRGARPRLGL